MTADEIQTWLEDNRTDIENALYGSDHWRTALAARILLYILTADNDKLAEAIEKYREYTEKEA